jgi:ATP-dependent DNA helicase RecG
MPHEGLSPSGRAGATVKFSDGDPGIEARLGRILDLEGSRGYADAAVMGGLDAFLDRAGAALAWARRSPPMSGRPYAALTAAERKAWAGSITARLGRGPVAPAATAGPRATATGRPAAAPAKASEVGSKARRPAQPPAEPAARRPRTPRTEPGARPAPLPLTLATSIADLGFVARTPAARLERLGVKKLKDLLWLFPNRHVDYSKAVKLHEVEVGPDVTVVGNVRSTEVVAIGPPPGAAKVVISDGTGLLTATFFRQAYLAERLRPGTRVALSGKVDAFRGRAQMENPEYEVLTGGDSLTHAGNLLPVYPSTEGLAQRTLRNAARKALEAGLPLLTDPVSNEITSRHSLPPLREAVEAMHFPKSEAQREEARRRLAFDELFINQLGVLMRRSEWQSRENGVPVSGAAAAVRGFLESLDYLLTGDQDASLTQILADMARPVPMGRLLQGEVGSGKTVVALAALLAAAVTGRQGALLAPTEVLAEQHFLSASGQLRARPVALLPDEVREFDVPSGPASAAGQSRRAFRVALLTGSMNAASKAAIRGLLAAGEVDIVVGTHALLEDTVAIPLLALAVIDEQHRFGVRQRAALTARVPRPHLLALSATPIPRTLSLTLYGDLELSTLKEMPRGRHPVVTRWARSLEDRARAYDLVRSEVRAARQAFVVCPLIDPSEEVQARSATLEYDRLRLSELRGLRVGLLHGRMGLREKQSVMDAMREREIDVLVATPVIEVGVDIPNATVMMIESADRFGLAQLHQFRGRVGRGAGQSTCYLMTDEPSEDARARLAIVERVSDGFQLAEEDLRLRGPGDYVGARQSGWAELQVANIMDVELLQLARVEAGAVLSVDPALLAPGHSALREAVHAATAGRPSEYS